MSCHTTKIGSSDADPDTNARADCYANTRSNRIGITPTSGPASGGTSITLSGAHFSNTTGVSFGSTTTSNFTVDSDTQITVVSPAGSSGTVDVTVTTAGGTSATSSNDQFTYYIIS